MEVAIFQLEPTGNAFIVIVCQNGGKNGIKSKLGRQACDRAKEYIGGLGDQPAD